MEHLSIIFILFFISITGYAKSEIFYKDSEELPSFKVLNPKFIYNKKNKIERIVFQAKYTSNNDVYCQIGDKTPVKIQESEVALDLPVDIGIISVFCEEIDSENNKASQNFKIYNSEPNLEGFDGKLHSPNSSKRAKLYWGKTHNISRLKWKKIRFVRKKGKKFKGFLELSGVNSGDEIECSLFGTEENRKIKQGSFKSRFRIQRSNLVIECTRGEEKKFILYEYPFYKNNEDSSKSAVSKSTKNPFQFKTYGSLLLSQQRYKSNELDSKQSDLSGLFDVVVSYENIFLFRANYYSNMVNFSNVNDEISIDYVTNVLLGYRHLYSKKFNLALYIGSSQRQTIFPEQREGYSPLKFITGSLRLEFLEAFNKTDVAMDITLVPIPKKEDEEMNLNHRLIHINLEMIGLLDKPNFLVLAQYENLRFKDRQKISNLSAISHRFSLGVGYLYF